MNEGPWSLEQKNLVQLWKSLEIGTPPKNKNKKTAWEI